MESFAMKRPMSLSTLVPEPAPGQYLTTDERTTMTTNPHPVPVGHPDRGLGPAPAEMNFALLHTAMGDTISCLPAIIYSAKKHPHVRHRVFAADYLADFIRQALKPQTNVTVVNLGKMGQGHEIGGLVAVSSSRGNVTPIREHIVRYAYTALLDRQPETMAQLEYPQVPPAGNPKSFGIRGDYVAVIVNFTSGLRAMRQDTLDAICSYVVGRGATPVLLGATSQDTGLKLKHAVFQALLAPQGSLDLRDKTTVVQAHALLAKARLVVGMDSGLLHLAACSSVNIVAGFTNVDPIAREPWRPAGEWMNVRPPASLACRGCMTQWDHSYNHDYLSCWHGDAACVDLIPTEKFLEAITCLL